MNHLYTSGALRESSDKRLTESMSVFLFLFSFKPLSNVFKTNVNSDRFRLGPNSKNFAFGEIFELTATPNALGLGRKAKISPSAKFLNIRQLRTIYAWAEGQKFRLRRNFCIGSTNFALRAKLVQLGAVMVRSPLF